MWYEPAVETRNRKPLLRTSVFGSAGEVWELRFGPNNRFRVFYRIDIDDRQVVVLALAVKTGNRLFIGGEELVL
ncbi:MAG: type II toxin-antitoxin system RelE/ParE family toxin [Chloroflexota bacterium]|nr:type II toxin-antitoxin system RelE/ParE family toxin [Chloroflexota bacterium]